MRIEKVITKAILFTLSEKGLSFQSDYDSFLVNTGLRRYACLKCCYGIKRIVHECSLDLHIVFMKRVYDNDVTRALASVIFVIVNEFHKNDM